MFKLNIFKALVMLTLIGVSRGTGQDQSMVQVYLLSGNRYEIPLTELRRSSKNRQSFLNERLSAELGDCAVIFLCGPGPVDLASEAELESLGIQAVVAHERICTPTKNDCFAFLQTRYKDLYKRALKLYSDWSSLPFLKTRDQVLEESKRIIDELDPIKKELSKQGEILADEIIKYYYPNLAGLPRFNAPGCVFMKHFQNRSGVYYPTVEHGKNFDGNEVQETFKRIQTAVCQYWDLGRVLPYLEQTAQQAATQQRIQGATDSLKNLKEELVRTNSDEAKKILALCFDHSDRPILFVKWQDEAVPFIPEAVYCATRVEGHYVSEVQKILEIEWSDDDFRVRHFPLPPSEVSQVRGSAD